MVEDREAPRANVPAAPKELLISKHPRANGVICVVLAVLLAGASAVCFWPSTVAGALTGPAVASFLLALVTVFIAVLAFRLGRQSSAAHSILGPLRLLGILAVAVGVAGVALGFIFGATTGSIVAVGAGVGLVVVSIVVAAQAALVYGAATSRS